MDNRVTDCVLVAMTIKGGVLTFQARRSGLKAWPEGSGLKSQTLATLPAWLPCIHVMHISESFLFLHAAHRVTLDH